MMNMLVNLTLVTIQQYTCILKLHKVIYINVIYILIKLKNILKEKR